MFLYHGRALGIQAQTLARNSCMNFAMVVLKLLLVLNCTGQISGSTTMMVVVIVIVSVVGIVRYIAQS